MKSPFTCLLLLCLPAFSTANPLVYNLTLGNYSYFGDWHSNLVGMTEQISAQIKINPVPVATGSNTASYESISCMITSGSFMRVFETGSMDVADGHSLFSGDLLHWTAINPGFPPYDEPFDSLDIQLKGTSDAFSSAAAPTSLNMADFPTGSFRLVVGDGPRLGSVVEGQVLNVNVSTNPEPATWMALGLGLIGLAKARRRSQ